MNALTLRSYNKFESQFSYIRGLSKKFVEFVNKNKTTTFKSVYN